MLDRLPSAFATNRGLALLDRNAQPQRRMASRAVGARASRTWMVVSELLFECRVRAVSTGESYRCPKTTSNTSATMSRCMRRQDGPTESVPVGMPPSLRSRLGWSSQSTGLNGCTAARRSATSPSRNRASINDAVAGSRSTRPRADTRREPLRFRARAARCVRGSDAPTPAR
jgi:hypothetical protein